MFKGTSIKYSVETDPDYYTHDEDDYRFLPGLISNIAEKVSEFIRSRFPGADYEIVEVPETMSYNNRSRVDGETEHEILETIGEYVGRNWCDWWPNE